MKWILVTLALTSITLQAQEGFLSYKGIIIDNEDKSPIPFAHILFSQHPNMGAISQIDGTFEIITSPDDTLIISSMVHEQKYIPVNELRTMGNTIHLDIKNYELSDVVVYSEEQLYLILERIIDRLPINYPAKDHQLIGYFQEYSIANEEYGHLLESFLTIENQNYAGKNKIARTDGYESYYAPHKVKVQQLRRSDDNRHLLINQYRSFSDMPIGQFLKQNLMYQKSILPWSQNLTTEDLAMELDHIMADTADMIHVYGLGTERIGKDTLINIGIDWLPIYFEQEDKRMYLKSTLWTINLSDYAVVTIRDQLSDELKAYLQEKSKTNEDYGEIRYRKIKDKYYPFFIAKDRGFSYMGSTQTDFVSRKFVVQEVILDKKNGFVTEGKKLPRGKRFNDIKFKYDQSYWSTIELPTLSDPMLTVKTELGRYKSLEDQYRANEKTKKQ